MSAANPHFNHFGRFPPGSSSYVRWNEAVPFIKLFFPRLNRFFFDCRKISRFSLMQPRTFCICRFITKIVYGCGLLSFSLVPLQTSFPLDIRDDMVLTRGFQKDPALGEPAHSLLSPLLIRFLCRQLLLPCQRHASRSYLIVLSAFFFFLEHFLSPRSSPLAPL